MAEWRLNTELVPNYDGGLMRGKYLIGGLRIVKSKVQRNAIPFLYRFFNIDESTLCFVETENQLYKLISNPPTTTTDADWELVNLGGISASLLPIGTWGIGNLSPTLTDSIAAGRNGEFYFVTGSPSPQTIMISGLFQSQAVTVVDGNLIVSVGSYWIVVANSTAWNSIDKPQVIIDYVNGIVITHTHTTDDITDLAVYLDNYLQREDTADHLIPFSSVPDTAIVEVEFLKQHYYTRSEVDDIIGLISGGGPVSFTDLSDVPGTYVGQGGKFVKVNTAENTLEFFTLTNQTERVAVLTTGGTIALDMSLSQERVFVGSSDIAANKIITISNITNAIRFELIFVLSDTYYLEFPINFNMLSQYDGGSWDSSTKRLTLDVGGYRIQGRYDGTNWQIDVYGPYTT